MDGAFALVPGARLSGRRVLVVDDVLTTTKGAISEGFRLDARDSDGDSLLYVITSLPADLRGVKGTTRFCADGDPDIQPRDGKR